MKDKLNLRGIITVLNTPFTSDNSIDYEGLKKNVEYAIESGVVGILVPALAAEVYKLTYEERLLIVKEVLNVNNGRVAIIGSATSKEFDETLKIAKKFVALGCNGILANIPFESKEQYKGLVKSLASVNPPFLMLQDWDFGGYGIPVETVMELFNEVECFKSFKIEVVPAGIKYSQIIKESNGQLHVTGGWAVTQLIEALDRGVDAFMPTGIHKTYVEIFNLYSKGKRDEAKKLFEKLVPILAFSNQHLDISLHFFKKLLHQQGVYTTDYCRKPILDFDDIHTKIANELISKAIKLEDSIEKLH